MKDTLNSAPRKAAMSEEVTPDPHLRNNRTCNIIFEACQISSNVLRITLHVLDLPRTPLRPSCSYKVGLVAAICG